MVDAGDETEVKETNDGEDFGGQGRILFYLPRPSEWAKSQTPYGYNLLLFQQADQRREGGRGMPAVGKTPERVGGKRPGEAGPGGGSGGRVKRTSNVMTGSAALASVIPMQQK